jgi:competence protein ComEC
MRFKEYPILKLLIAIIIGILLAKSEVIPIINWYYILLPIIILSLLSWPNKNIFPYKYRNISGLFIYFTFILLGFLLYQNSFESIRSGYFGNIKNLENKYYQIRIIEPPQEKPNSIKIYAEVEAVETNDTIKASFGKLLIYLQKDSIAQKLEYGDKLAFNKKINTIEAPKNPEQFNYKAYLQQKDILFQTYLRSGEWNILVSNEKYGIVYNALKLRSYLLHILETNNVKGDELGIAAGMLLGLRDLLSPELRQAYTGAGAMHILCVSGLHVGILFLILNALLSFLNHSHKTKIIKASIIMLFIWFYALLTGLSPSVVRSATMFTFVIIGQNINRHTNILGSLSASAFLLLIINPSLLFDLGFQLSYSAVVAIVILQKPIENLWIPNNIVIYKIWQLITVSIAAQIGTLPISLYYFHQFPNLFLLTNIIVIPAAYIVIILGITVLLTSFIPPISLFLGKVLSNFLGLLNLSISKIEHWQYSVTKDIFLNSTLLILLITLIISMSIWLLLIKKKMIFVNISIIIFILIANNIKYENSEEVVFYHSTKNTYLAFYSGREAVIICDSAVINNPNIMSFQVGGNELIRGIKSRKFLQINKLEEFENSKICIKPPFIRFNNENYAFSPIKNTSYSPIKVDYFIIDKLMNLKSEIIDSSSSIILAANIPKWKTDKIKNTISEKGSYYSIRDNKAWVKKAYH